MKKYLVIALLSVVLLACKVIKPKETFTATEKTEVTYQKQTVQIKGAKVTVPINMDSLYKVASNLRKKWQADSTKAAQTGKPIPPKPKAEVKYITDPQTKAQLSYWMDVYGKLQVGCESKDQTVNLLVAQINKLKQQVSTTTVVDYKTPTWAYCIMAVLAVLLLITKLKK